MRKKQMTMVILALALGAWGCGSDDDDNPGGSGGTGASGGTGGTGGTGGITTECNQEPDLGLATSVEFSGQFWDCYDTADMDVELSVDSCVQETPGLSVDCASCYGEYAGCIDTACAESCNERGDDTLPCSQCLMTECNLDLTSCSGVGFPAVLPQTT